MVALSITGKKVPKEQNGLENYMDMTGGSEATAKKPESDYANVTFDEIKQGRKAVIDDLELYENPTSTQSTETKDNHGDLEDYENTKDVFAKMEASEKVTDDDSGNMEDYENMEVYENTPVKTTKKKN